MEVCSVAQDDDVESVAPVAAPQRRDLDRAPVRRRPAPTRRGGVPIDVLAAIAAGGALGTPARYGLAQVIQVPTGGFPWATLWTNLSGSLVLGFVLVLIIERFPPTRYVRPFFAVGFLGAYTTFSTYAVETDVLLKDGHVATAVTYALASLVAGFVAVWSGIVLGRLIPLGEHP
jgi:fluoride exporter